MAITPVTAVTLEILTALGQGVGGARGGGVIEAKVTAMLTDKLARLNIGGQTVDVATPRPLPVGAALTLKAEWQGGRLKLIELGGGGKPSTQPALSAPRNNAAAQPGGAPLASALTRLQAIAVQTLLSGGEGGEAAPSQPLSPGPPLKPPSGLDQALAPKAAPAAPPLNLGALVQALARQTLQPPRAAPDDTADLARNTLADAPEAQSRPAKAAAVAVTGQATASSAPGSAGEIAEPQKKAAEELASARPNAAAVTPDAQPRAERPAPVIIELPFLLPGSQEPLRLEVHRDAPESGPDGGGERAGSWMVRFGSDTGSLGHFDAAVSLIGGHIGVNLWAERGETAERFAANLHELRDALLAAGLMLDAVRAGHGAPPDKAGGAA
jgi:hypothetical protein